MATSSSTTTDTAAERMDALATEWQRRAKDQTPWTDDEIDAVLASFENFGVSSNHKHNDKNHDKNDDTPEETDWKASLKTLLKHAHESYKEDWAVTETRAAALRNILRQMQDDTTAAAAAASSTNNSLPAQFLDRIFTDGNWKGALEHAAAAARNENSNDDENNIPWAVLVTGVNGIRKTTSIYQAWFPQVLNEALVAPKETKNANTEINPASSLPVGSNSFFRQLDHMICTVCNEHFATLYQFVNELVNDDNNNDDNDTTESTTEITPAMVGHYSNLKAAIFARYRTLSEWLGVVLLREAQTLGINCLMETSGRDVAMFSYVDHLFGSTNSNTDGTSTTKKYRKLALHFQVDDLTQAVASVDARMLDEMATGRTCTTPRQVVAANQGGPYAGDVLAGVQADSDRVWKTVTTTTTTSNTNDDYSDWYFATIQVNAKAGVPWTAQAVRPDGSLGTEFEFVR